MRYFEIIISATSKALNRVGMFAVVVMMLLTTADVIGRYFRHPIPGTWEVTGFLNVLVVAFAVAHTQILRGHISVDILISRIPKRFRAVLGSITSLLVLCLFALIAWQSWIYATQLWQTGTRSYAQQLPFYFVVYAMSVACVPVCLVFLMDFLKYINQVRER